MKSEARVYREGRDRTVCYRNELSVETDLEGAGGSVTCKELPATAFSWMRASTWDTFTRSLQYHGGIDGGPKVISQRPTIQHLCDNVQA